MDPEKLPEVCIVSAHPLSTTIANGIALSSFFDGWPGDRLTQVYLPVGVSYLPDSDVCRDYRMIRPSGLVSRSAAPSSRPRSSTRQRPSSRALRRIQALRGRRGLHRWLKLAQELWFAHSWLGRALQRELDRVRPDVVLAVLSNYGLTKITYLSCRQLGIPTAVYVTDDYVEAQYADKPFSALLTSASDRWFRRIAGAARARAANNPLLAAEYAERYGGDWHWFTQLVDARAYDAAPRAGDRKVRLVFVGNLDLGRARSLRLLAQALQELREQRGVLAELVIYSFPERLDAFRELLDVPLVTTLGGHARLEEVPGILHGADVVVHAEGSDARTRQIARLSLSTKIGQYTMAGRCILALGPTELGSARIIREAGAGVAIGATSPTQIRAALEPVLLDRNARGSCARRGREWAERWVDLDRGRLRFQAWLSGAAKVECDASEPSRNRFSKN